MKASSVLLLILGMAAGVIALAVGLRQRSSQVVADHWRTRLATVSDRRAGALLRQIAALGEPGIPVLVETLGSERESVARAGKQLLAELLDHWQRIPPETGIRKQALLADALASQAPRFGPNARAAAAELATQILRWLPETAGTDRAWVIGRCEEVLRTAAAEDEPSLDTILAGPSASLVERAEGTSTRPWDENPKESGVPAVAVSRLPGGGLRPELPSSSDAVPRVAEVPPGHPRHLPPSFSGQPIDPARPLHRLSNAVEGVYTAPQPAPLPDEAGEVVPQAFSSDLAEAETVDLMRRLRAEDQVTASGAKAELVRRGFRTVHLELARRLFDPDAEVRKRLARTLPGLTSVDAAPWMLWLSRDADPEVRLTAITLLATTADPALLEQLEQIVSQDPDPRIQRQAARIAQRNRQR